MNKKNAFSFTELMIVVSIIGVIASFMIPALVKTEPNEAALNYKKTFFALIYYIWKYSKKISLTPCKM